MPSLERDDVPYLDPEFEMVALANGSMIARGAPGASLFNVIQGDLEALSAILETIDGILSVQGICQALAGRYGEPDLIALLNQLYDDGYLRIRDEDLTPANAGQRHKVRIVGSDAMAKAFHEGLRALGVVRADRIDAPPRLADRDFTARLAQSRYPRPATDAKESARDTPDAVEAIGALQQACGDAELLVCALEDAPYESLGRVERICAESGVPCLFVTYERGRVLIGPTLVPGHSPGFCASRCALVGQNSGGEDESFDSNLGLLTAQRISADGETGRELLGKATAAVVQEVERCFSPGPLPQLFRSILIVENNAVGEFVMPPDMASPTPERAESVQDLEHDLALSADIALGRLANLRARSRDPLPTAFRTVGIVGGGTAGYLTALALRRKLPQLEVTVIESTKIPIIGVGEATTALLVHFLHSYLGLDIVDFYKRVQPTWKLGIRFEWGPPGDYFYNSPFQFGRILEALLYDGDISRSCLASCLMTTNRTSIVRSCNGTYRSLLSEIPYAYHLDNERFVHYLREQAARFCIRHIDCIVENVVNAEDGRSIEHLQTDDGRKLDFDLFVDCTGFRSLLIEKALGSPYLSYESSLFADTAIMADIPNDGVVRPYTSAETMNNGWCWNIPMEDSDHRGYVFSSSFSSMDEAADEMRRKNPTMGEPWSTRFRSGRHEHFWKGNVVAIGNSYGFVEPLQSTAIHMIIVEIQKMIESFPTEVGLLAFQPVVNQRVGAIWDHLRWFLAAHYRYNDRFDTEFWKACRATADVSGIQELIGLYHERAPIGSTPARFEELDDSTFGVFRHDLLFMGQQLETTYVQPELSKAAWLRISAANDRIVERAVDHREALRVVRQNPEMLQSHVRDLD